MTRYAIHNCYTERYGSRGNIVWPCGGCASCIAVKHSREVGLKHRPTKFCVESNVCTYCCSLKYVFRALKHSLFGGLRCGRKCEICLGTQASRKYCEQNTRGLICAVYILYLGGKYYYPLLNRTINVGVDK